MRTAIVGGGAAGFFAAISLKERCPQMRVTLFERSRHLLRKVLVSGGGRCNCTNTFEDVADLSHVYPRGHRLMKRLMKGFSQKDAYAWFEAHGVPLVVQPDQCVFPAAQDAHAVADCFLHHARRYGVDIVTGTAITSLDDLSDYDYIVLAMGGQPRMESLRWLQELGHEIVAPVPSLFTFGIDDAGLHALMGTVVEDATAFIPATTFRASGPLLVTHWGMSGPAILKLSSYAARYLAEHAYQSPLAVNWTGCNEEQARQHLLSDLMAQAGRQLTSIRSFDLPSRLWHHLVAKALSCPTDAAIPIASLGKKAVNRLVAVLTADAYDIASRAPFKDEFVTCGGIALSAVNAATLESRHRPHLYFVGELLDIDGITGGFNFQAAWTTAYTAAKAIAEAVQERA